MGCTVTIRLVQRHAEGLPVKVVADKGVNVPGQGTTAL